MGTANQIVTFRDLPDFRSFLKNPVASPLTITGTVPSLIFDDTTAGDDNYSISADADILRIQNTDNNATVLRLVDGAGEDFDLNVDTDILNIINTTGPITYIRFRGGANDDIQVDRPIVFNSTVTLPEDITLSGASPSISFVDTGGEDYTITVDADNLVIANTTGPVNFITLTGGVTDDITLHRATKVTGILTIESTIPLLTFSDTDGDDYHVTVDTGSLRITNNAGNATIVRLNDNGGGAADDFSITVDNSVFTITDIDQSKTWEFKGSGFLRQHTRCIHIDTTSTGNVGTGLDTLRSISIAAATLPTNNDYLAIEFGGTLGANDDDKRLFFSFGGTTITDTTLLDFDGGVWWCKILIVRTSATTCRVTGYLMVQFLNNLSGTAGGNGLATAIGVASLAVSDLTSNANTLLVQGESATATNDNVICNISKVEVNQIT